MKMVVGGSGWEVCLQLREEVSEKCILRHRSPVQERFLLAQNFNHQKNFFNGCVFYEKKIGCVWVALRLFFGTSLPLLFS
jgi:hypothetical protein